MGWAAKLGGTDYTTSLRRPATQSMPRLRNRENCQSYQYLLLTFRDDVHGIPTLGAFRGRAAWVSYHLPCFAISVLRRRYQGLTIRRWLDVGPAHDIRCGERLAVPAVMRVIVCLDRRASQGQAGETRPWPARTSGWFDAGCRQTFGRVSKLT